MRVLFLDEVHPILEKRLTAAGWQCDREYKASYDEILNRIGNYEGLVIRSRIPVDEELLRAAARMRFIARSGSGLENINMGVATALGIEVFSSPEGNRDAVGEHAIGMLLMLLNNLKRADAEVRQGMWRRAENRGQELSHKTVGIIGYGQMGSAFAEKLSGFGSRVIAYDKYRLNLPQHYAHEVSLKQLQQEADVISIHLPLNEETRYYVDREFISKCAKPFILINTSRGNQVNSDALVEGLKSGKIKGACLDVIEFERSSFEQLNTTEHIPESLKYLLGSDRVLLSPHIAGWTHESYFKLSDVLADKIMAVFGQGGE